METKQKVSDTGLDGQKTNTSHKSFWSYDPWEPVDAVRPAAADFVRVVAIGTIGWFHIWQQTWVGGGILDHWPRGGACMVDVMILLSAFCLFLPYANAMADGKPLPEFAPLEFYRKRAVRIVPSYYVNLAFSLVYRLIWYGSSAALWLDLIAHLTFTQAFFQATHLTTLFNGVTWTLTALAIFYIVFPFLAKWACKMPVQVITALLAVQWFWTRLALHFHGDGTSRYSMLTIQFPAFFGVFAVGFLGAWALAYFSRRPVLQTKTARITFTLLGLAALYGLDFMMKAQGSSADAENFRLVYRIPLVLIATGCMVCFALGVTLPLRRVWKWLSSISYNFYLWHQLLPLFFKYTLYLPYWSGDTPPNQLGDTVWQHQANRLYWLAAIASAIFFTYGVEMPVSHWFKQRKANRKEER